MKEIRLAGYMNESVAEWSAVLSAYNVHSMIDLSVEGSKVLNPTGASVILIAGIDDTHRAGVDSIATFVHPDNALYCFGSDTSLIVPEYYEAHHKVYIPAYNEAHNYVYAAQAAAIVLYDRMTKMNAASADL